MLVKDHKLLVTTLHDTYSCHSHHSCHSSNLTTYIYTHTYINPWTHSHSLHTYIYSSICILDYVIYILVCEVLCWFFLYSDDIYLHYSISIYPYLTLFLNHTILLHYPHSPWASYWFKLASYYIWRTTLDSLDLLGSAIVTIVQ